MPEIDRTPDEEGRWLLAQLLSWHRRENKSAWWLYYHLRDDLTDAERIEASEPLAGLEFVGEFKDEKGATLRRYRLSRARNTTSRSEEPSRIPSPGRAQARWSPSTTSTCTVDLRAAGDKPHPTALIPTDWYGTGVMEESLLRLGTGWRIMECKRTGRTVRRSTC